MSCSDTLRTSFREAGSAGLYAVAAAATVLFIAATIWWIATEPEAAQPQMTVPAASGALTATPAPQSHAAGSRVSLRFGYIDYATEQSIVSSLQKPGPQDPVEIARIAATYAPQISLTTNDAGELELVIQPTETAREWIEAARSATCSGVDAQLQAGPAAGRATADGLAAMRYSFPNASSDTVATLLDLGQPVTCILTAAQNGIALPRVVHIALPALDLSDGSLEFPDKLPYDHAPAPDTLFVYKPLGARGYVTVPRS